MPRYAKQCARSLLILALAVSNSFWHPNGCSGQCATTAPNRSTLEVTHPAYLYAIDVSASMSWTIGGQEPTGDTNEEIRWERMRKLAVDSFESLPIGSAVWVVEFNDTLREDQIQFFPQITVNERNRLVKKYKEQSAPKRGTTAYLDAVDRLIRQARVISSKHRFRQVEMFVYSDGEESGDSKLFKAAAEVGKDKEATIHKVKGQLAKRLAELLKLNPNARLSQAHIIPEQTQGVAAIIKGANKLDVKATLGVIQTTKQIVLSHPKERNPQRAELTFCWEDTPALNKAIDARQLQFRFVPKPTPSSNGFSNQIQVEVAPIKWRRGSNPITVRVKNPNDLEPNKSFSGDLHFVYPVIDKYLVSGPKSIRVTFQAQNVVRANLVYPIDGDVFTQGAKAQLQVIAPEDASVSWKIGGTVVSGNQSDTYACNRAGEHDLTVTVTDKNRKLQPYKKTIKLKVVKVGLDLSSPQESIIEGTSVSLLAKRTTETEETFSDFTWTVNGIAVRPNGIGESQGADLTEQQVTFSKFPKIPAGEKFADYTIGVHGIIARSNNHAAVEATKTIRVFPAPKVSFISPAMNSDLLFDQEIPIKVSTSGPVATVKIERIVGDDRIPVLTLQGRGVLTNNTKRFGFDANKTKLVKYKAAVKLVATPEVEKGFDYEVGSDQSSTTVFNLSDPELELQLATADGGSKFKFGNPIEFILTGFQDKFIKTISWDFGDGSDVENSKVPNPKHAFPSTGSFTVRADVTDRLGRKVSKELTVHIDSEVDIKKAKITDPSSPEAEHSGIAYAGAKINLVSGMPANAKAMGYIVAWYAVKPDGTEEKLPEGVSDYVCENEGKHILRREVLTPPDQAGKRTTLASQDLTVTVIPKPNHGLFIGYVILGAFFTWLAWRIVMNNEPRAWKLYYSNTGSPSEALSMDIRISTYWSRWKKRAYVPIADVFGECDHWGIGDGSNEHFMVMGQKLGNNLSGVVEYSAEGANKVKSNVPDGDERRIDYQWTDRRCGDENYQTLFLKLVLERGAAGTAWLAFGVLFSGIVAMVVWGWFEIYRA